MLKLILTLVTAAGLAGCAAYGPATGSGPGYSEHDLADGTIKVTFRGTTAVSKDATVKYWLHRCAELTISRGFTYFALLADPNAPRSEMQDVPDDVASGDSRSPIPHRADGIIQVRGGAAVPIITFIPTGGGTYWTKSGAVRLFHSRAGFSDEQAYSLHAPTVLKLLKPLLETGKEEVTPDVRDVVTEAMKVGQPAASPVLRRL